MAIDVIMKTGSDGLYDIEWDKNGDLLTTNGLESALDISILGELRADESEMVIPQNRRGWWGSTVLGYEQGSKLWLLSQARKTEENRILSEQYAYQALQWMLDSKIAKEITVNSEFTSEGLLVKIKLVAQDNTVISRYYEMWKYTDVEHT
ncbi:MAG: phage GP46 family protein [Bacilli bacterium]|nr:phage GP46 family protein [Bacilli bacterium]